MASKSKSRRRVFRASCILAALIVAGSSFAWFTSKDEVTNRLTASSNYGVAIAEDFTPPENWIPGQEINKDVGVVNTGNVDAFTRVWLEGEMNILNKKPSDAVAETKGSPADITDVKTVTDASLLAMGLKYNDGGTYYRILGKTEVDNPEDDNTAANQDTAVDDKTYSEVKTVQAGGWLAYASDGAAFTFNPEQEYTYTKSGGDGTATVAAGTAVASSLINSAAWRNGAGLAIDSDTFTPTADGLYIFRRIINDKSTTDGYSYEYSGYYFDADKNEYFALEYTTSDNSDYVIDPALLTITHSIAGDATTPVVKVENAGVKLFQAQYTEVENSGLKWIYDSTNKTLTAVYAGADGKYKFQMNGTDRGDYSADDIAVVVKLADTGTTGQTWNGITSTGTTFEYYPNATGDKVTATTDQKTTFYYNDDVEENDTTARLVDSVTLSSDTRKEAFLAFDFDLNVKMDSIQVTKDATGSEGFETVKTGWDSDNSNVTKAKATATVGNPEINSITWEATT